MSRKSGHKCLYFNCGKSGRTVIGLKLYRFPKNPKLQQQWVINSGKIYFKYSHIYYTIYIYKVIKKMLLDTYSKRFLNIIFIILQYFKLL
jgi:hypothetical protein